MDGWNTIVSFWDGLFSGSMLVWGSVEFGVFLEKHVMNHLWPKKEKHPLFIDISCGLQTPSFHRIHSGSVAMFQKDRSCWNKSGHANGTITYCWWFRNPANQLRLVAYPIVYRVLAPSQVIVWDFWTINSRKQYICIYQCVCGYKGKGSHPTQSRFVSQA